MYAHRAHGLCSGDSSHLLSFICFVFKNVLLKFEVSCDCIVWFHILIIDPGFFYNALIVEFAVVHTIFIDHNKHPGACSHCSDSVLPPLFFGLLAGRAWPAEVYIFNSFVWSASWLGQASRSPDFGHPFLWISVWLGQAGRSPDL